MNNVEIFEVGPRDGFQNISQIIKTDFKKQIISDLYDSGVKSIQYTSFVNPKKVPQMRDAKELSKYVEDYYSDKSHYALVPNFKGALLAYENKMNTISFVLSVSESHNKNNVGKTHNQSFEELKKVRDEFSDMYIILDLATTFGCSIEGASSIEKVIRFVNRALSIGVNEINLCDTMGLAYPSLVSEVINTLKDRFPDSIFRAHFHDTRNMGIANSLEAIRSGVNRIESSLGGLGGCPFAPGATGNTSTEDLVYMLEKMEYSTGIDFIRLLATAKMLYKNIEGNYSGHHININ
jgi:hydroxymethylglutaryl-CoA lyase